MDAPRQEFFIRIFKTVVALSVSRQIIFLCACTGCPIQLFLATGNSAKYLGVLLINERAEGGTCWKYQSSHVWKPPQPWWCTTCRTKAILIPSRRKFRVYCSSAKDSRPGHLKVSRLILEGYQQTQNYSHTDGLPIRYPHTENQFADEPEGLRHFRDHCWKTLGKENSGLSGLFLFRQYLESYI